MKFYYTFTTPTLQPLPEQVTEPRDGHDTTDKIHSDFSLWSWICDFLFQLLLCSVTDLNASYNSLYFSLYFFIVLPVVH